MSGEVVEKRLGGGSSRWVTPVVVLLAIGALAALIPVVTTEPSIGKLTLHDGSVIRILATTQGLTHRLQRGSPLQRLMARVRSQQGAAANFSVSTSRPSLVVWVDAPYRGTDWGGIQSLNLYDEHGCWFGRAGEDPQLAGGFNTTAVFAFENYPRLGQSFSLQADTAERTTLGMGGGPDGSYTSDGAVEDRPNEPLALRIVDLDVETWAKEQATSARLEVWKGKRANPRWRPISLRITDGLGNETERSFPVAPPEGVYRFDGLCAKSPKWTVTAEVANTRPFDRRPDVVWQIPAGELLTPLGIGRRLRRTLSHGPTLLKVRDCTNETTSPAPIAWMCAPKGGQPLVVAVRSLDERRSLPPDAAISDPAEDPVEELGQRCWYLPASGREHPFPLPDGTSRLGRPLIVEAWAWSLKPVVLEAGSTRR